MEQSPLAQYREKTGKTLETLAQAFGVDKSTVWRWEMGRVPASRIIEIERVTNIPRRKLRPDLFETAR